MKKIKYKTICNHHKHDIYWSPVNRFYNDRLQISYPYSYKSVSHPEYSIDVVRTLVSVPAHRGYGVLTREEIEKNGYDRSKIKVSTIKPVYEYVVTKNGKSITENKKTVKECKNIIKSLIEKECA
jgi:hypothetical protein